MKLEIVRSLGWFILGLLLSPVISHIILRFWEG